MTVKPKIGLALGAGGARGFAHIGVLKVLLDHQIPIDFIAGSSIGSLVAVLYANDLDLKMLEKLAVHLKRKHWLDLTVPKMGFVQGEKIKELIRLLTHGKHIEDLSIPISVVATDLENGERVIFDKGSIERAVRASISIPGIFVPERVDGRLLVDGGVIDRVPITVAKDMGADLVIAVDVGPSEAKMGIESIFDVISRTIDIMGMEIFRTHILNADFLIRPEVGSYSSTDFNHIQEIISLGEVAALETVESIKERIDQWKGEKHEGRT
ncbi:patatin-like phospholipase family protein [Microaerobacter geothermalis]|uniref:patatin-like phospholipase family protein n=1 Tax=Microaerobacter geothermalis TaxID=674972 RepID=UPI001F25B3D6|nr:patatin-like phospholipase family protein [Microaerobacter geothermalis]MCF6095042.1 patatin-like phospholipase family protein [Microaerobacter geothermalis]